MKFQVCYNLSHFWFSRFVIECPEELFKKLLIVTIYLYNFQKTFLKSQIYDKIVTVWLSYHFSVTKGLFEFLLMQVFQHNLKTGFLKMLVPLVKNWSFCKKKLFFSIFLMSITLPYIYEHALIIFGAKCIFWKIINSIYDWWMFISTL